MHGVSSHMRMFLAVIITLIASASSIIQAGETNIPSPFAGIICRSEVRQDPPQRLFVAEIDISNPQVHVRVSRGGPDPDGLDKWQTTLMPPTKIAAREKFDLVVNGDFFLAKGANDGEGTNASFRAAMWASVLGPAVSDGKVWATSATNRPSLVVYKDGMIAIQMCAVPTPDKLEVVAGNTMLVEEGMVVPHTNKLRHPRTVAGLNVNGTKLIILVVDGRKPRVAVGMSYDELAAEMIRLGCRTALNLDGGGSTVMALRDPQKNEFRILNEPTDGRERAVGNALGISVDSASK